MSGFREARCCGASPEPTEEGTERQRWPGRGSRAIVNVKGGRQGTGRNGSTVTHHANAESARSTVGGATSGLRPSTGPRLSDRHCRSPLPAPPEHSAAEPLIAVSSRLPKACPASGSPSEAAQRRDTGATPQTGFSLGPQAAGSSLTPKQEPPPISSFPRSASPSGVRVPARSSAGGLYPASEAFPLSGLGRPRCPSLCSHRSRRVA
jgi:hypothetical protein